MTSDPDGAPQFIWATRGKTWGFRFLRRGGFEDPLGVYEAAFSKVGDQPESWHRDEGRVAMRFPDPEGRCDASGRVIPHDFVLLGLWAEELTSLDDGRERVWPAVAEEYQSVWDKSSPPSSR